MKFECYIAIVLTIIGIFLIVKRKIIGLSIYNRQVEKYGKTKYRNLLVGDKNACNVMVGVAGVGAILLAVLNLILSCYN